jgi:hypothetical protein
VTPSPHDELTQRVRIAASIMAVLGYHRWSPDLAHTAETALLWADALIEAINKPKPEAKK